MQLPVWRVLSPLPTQSPLAREGGALRAFPSPAKSGCVRVSARAPPSLLLRRRERASIRRERGHWAGRPASLSSPSSCALRFVLSFFLLQCDNRKVFQILFTLSLDPKDGPDDYRLYRIIVEAKRASAKGVGEKGERKTSCVSGCPAVCLCVTHILPNARAPQEGSHPSPLSLSFLFLPLSLAVDAALCKPFIPSLPLRE